MEPRRFLITGLNGLIGWNLFKKFRQTHEVTGTYRKFHPEFRDTPVFQIDPEREADMTGLIRELRPDVIVHAWAMCDLDLCEEMPHTAWKTNVEGTRVLLEAARRVPGLRKFVYISTDHIFSGDRGLYTENDEPSPKHIYGRTKLEAEKLVRNSGLPWMIIRPGLVIGKSLQGNKGPRDFLFARIRAGKPTHYFTDEWRSPVPAEDLSEEVLRLSCSPETGIFHVAGPRVCSRFELAFELALSHGLPTEQIHPRKRQEDRWAHIRPRDISLASRTISVI